MAQTSVRAAVFPDYSRQRFVDRVDRRGASECHRIVTLDRH